MLRIEILAKNQKLLIGGLLLMAAFVIFILPNYVSEPWVAEAVTQTHSNSNLPTPSTVAEKTKYRQQSQTLLAEIIMLRDRLKSQSVEQWDKFQFDESMLSVEAGDQHYGQGNYDRSLASYNQALTRLQKIQQVGENKLKQALTDGELAIESVQPSAVPEVLNFASLAMAIAPDNSQSQYLSQRASKFAAFVETVQQADKLFKQQQYQAAKKVYKKALDINPEHKTIQVSLQNVENAIKQQNFIALMSQGYTALDNNDFDQAQAAFNRADALYSDNPSVAQALAHLDSRRSQIYIDQQIAVAIGLEQQEEWHQAQTVYKQLLETDATLIHVKAKLITATTRTNLDSGITSIINDPLILADQTTYKKAQQLLADSQEITGPGAKLKQQIDALKSLVKQARIPIHINLESDNLTEVTLFKIAKLGTFEHRSVKLFPGRYTLLGSRKGYRDTQIEIEINGLPTEQAIRIICSEKI